MSDVFGDPVTNISGAIGPTGPAGPAGPAGATGGTGPAGVGVILATTPPAGVALAITDAQTLVSANGINDGQVHTYIFSGYVTGCQGLGLSIAAGANLGGGAFILFSGIPAANTPVYFPSIAIAGKFVSLVLENLNGVSGGASPTFFGHIVGI